MTNSQGLCLFQVGPISLGSRPLANAGPFAPTLVNNINSWIVRYTSHSQCISIYAHMCLENGLGVLKRPQQTVRSSKRPCWQQRQRADRDPQRISESIWWQTPFEDFWSVDGEAVQVKGRATARQMNEQTDELDWGSKRPCQRQGTS